VHAEKKSWKTKKSIFFIIPVVGDAVKALKLWIKVRKMGGGEQIP
jgi:hypothetical protein